MMKSHSILTGGLAALFVLPLFAQDQVLRTLENALFGTNQALDSVGKIQERFHQDPLAGIVLILAATETPKLEEQERDRRLQELRDEVNALQMRYDSMLMMTDPGAVPRASDRPSTTGLSPALRDQLLRPRGQTAREPSSLPPSSAKVLPNGPSYSADSVAQARTYYRLSRYQEGLDTLKAVGDDPVGLYWRARCLEKLGHPEKAVSELQRVVELAPESREGKRAKTDIDFLTWTSERKRKLTRKEDAK